jgi:hypothetical protein
MHFQYHSEEESGQECSDRLYNINEWYKTVAFSILSYFSFKTLASLNDLDIFLLK